MIGIIFEDFTNAGTVVSGTRKFETTNLRGLPSVSCEWYGHC
jgi:hypothetical protein